MQTDKTFEIVLPISGRFARLHRPTWKQFLVAATAKELFMPALMAQVCEIDGKRLTLEEWLESDFEDICPLIHGFNETFKGIGSQRGVA